MDYISIIKKHKTKKNLGQNFLVDKNIIDKVIETSSITENDYIVEIGPGLGFLTKEIRSTNIEVIEIDQELIPILKQIGNIMIRNIDVLDYQIPNIPFKLIANIPYYLTSPIIRKFITESLNIPGLVVLMIQKEVAEKIIAKDNKKSVLYWLVNLYGKPEIIEYVSKDSFYPSPKVDSAILKFVPYKKPLISRPKKFLDFIKICFSGKRKKISTTLSNHFGLPKEKIISMFNSININPCLRPEKISLSDWEEIINLF